MALLCARACTTFVCVCVLVLSFRRCFGLPVLLGARLGDGEGRHRLGRPEDGLAQGQREARVQDLLRRVHGQGGVRARVQPLLLPRLLGGLPQREGNLFLVAATPVRYILACEVRLDWYGSKMRVS